MTDAAAPPPDDDEPSDELAAKLFDYHEGTLAPEHKAEVEAYLRARGEPLGPGGSGARLPISTLPRGDAPSAFADTVAQTIHARSGGRFFARRTLGDRVPFGWLLAVALVLLIGLAVFLARSPTGSLDLTNPPPSPPPAPSGLAP